MKTKLPASITWKAQSHKDHKRSPAWYLGFAIISAALILYAIFLDRSIMTVITFALMMLVLFIFVTQPVRVITNKLTSTSIISGNVTYPYKIVRTFWINYNPPEVKTLNFETTAYLNNKVSVELGDQDPVAVKLFLSQYLPEDLDREERLSETLARTLKI